jgi:hypothetical protein
MIGVDQDNLGPQTLNLAVKQGFDRPLAGDWGKGRSFDNPVRRLDLSRPG